MASRPPIVLAALVLLGLPAVSRALTPTLDPEQLQPGRKAVVRTVFQGQRIEEFEAEILGVFKGGRVDGDLIVARATSERLQRTGIAQGMSGSPVYVDGKLVGALSGAWAFSRDPLFVVTPIREMLAVLDQPTGDPGDVAGTAGPSGLGTDSESAFGEFRWPGLPGSEPAPGPDPTLLRTRYSGAPASLASGSPARLAVPVACAGLEPALVPLARELMEPLGFTAVPGGTSGTAAESGAAFEPGSAVAVELLRGDLRFAAIGTVTWRDGDRVLIFGHPFFQSGNVRLPLASASITTIVASNLISFKLGMPGDPVGVATQDRRAAVAGRVGPLPHLMPVAVSIAAPGTSERTFRFESIEDRELAPQLVSIAAVNSLLESGGTGPNQTVRWTITLHRRGTPPLRLSDMVSSELPLRELVAALGSPLRFLYTNPFARLTLDSIAVRLDALPRREQWALRSAQVLDPAVRPGESVRVRCELERWRGAREAVTLALRVPEELPEGRYVLWLGGGPELSRYEGQRLPGRYRPSSLDEAWERLAGYRPSDGLYGVLLARAPEVTRGGRDYPELPTSALALLAGGQTAEDATRRGSQAVLDEVRRRFDGQVRGELQLEIQVDPKAP